MGKKTILLVCNAHVDPVWLWRWEEGLGETLSTFRIAASFCEQWKGFVFNHNEALLYRWIQEYDSDLFLKIQKLVKERRWHIMGGWYVQPDCNLPSGESFVRQILVGKRYFLNHFGVEPRTAVNLDPFGHSRGLVQILSKSGYDSYLFCRPDSKYLSLPDADFCWKGVDGSSIVAHRAKDHYNSFLGRMKSRLDQYMKNGIPKETGLLLWGIGDHGGGPSEADLTAIADAAKETKDWDIRHSTPEAYFDQLSRDRLPVFSGDLNPWAVGCYTSMARIKQKHRLLENEIFCAEKMAAHAAWCGRPYPKAALREALEDLLFCEFHDILPGTSIQEVEWDAIQKLDHGLEIARGIKSRSFFELTRNEKPASPGEIPILIYNPHPFAVEGPFVAEFQPQEPNPDKSTFWQPELKSPGGEGIPCQVEKESCNIQCDQRKRISFNAILPPSQTVRLSCVLKSIPVDQKPVCVQISRSDWCFRNETCTVMLNPKTGLLDGYRVDGTEFLKKGSFAPIVLGDSADPWGMRVTSFKQRAGSFHLMSAQKSAAFAGVDSRVLQPMRIIEEGPIRTIVEALFHHGHSTLCMRYHIPKKGNELEIELRIFWNEKNRMLKLSLPVPLKDSFVLGQIPYGVARFQEDREQAAQQWLAVASGDRVSALTVINDRTYGFDHSNQRLNLSLLRSPAYAGHPVDDKTPIVRQDRFETRIDQGEHLFRFWIQGGSFRERLQVVDREALVKNQPPMIVSYNPEGKPCAVQPGVMIDGKAVQVTAVKWAEEEKDWILRIYNPTENPESAEIRVPLLKTVVRVDLLPFEFKTLAYESRMSRWSETDLIERQNPS